jgi:capsular exopolysaccharide synthesis family protein
VELRQYFTVIWRWLWLIVLGTLLAGGTAYLVSRNMTPIYRASTTLLINQARNPAITDYTSLITSERLAKTYAELFTKRPVLEEVANRLGVGIEETEEAGRGGLPTAIDVSPVRDTQLIQVNVEGDDPQLAMDIANTLPEVFIEQNAEMQLSRFASSKENLSEQLAIIESDMEATQQAINDLQGSDPAADQAELARLQTLLAQHQSNYASLLSSYEGIRLAEVQAMDNIVVAEPAELPKYPIKPRKLQNTLLAAVVGCMLAVGVAFLIEYLDDTIKTSEDVGQALALSTLGAITRFQSTDDQDRLITASHPRSPISEAYRALRTNIQFSAVDNPLRTLLVTSTNPTEGKTTTVANLGTVMAQAGLSVIVVDSDLRRPALHQYFEASRNLGLTNALLDKNLSTDGYLQATEVENLRVLTCGPLPPNPSELLNSQRMRELMEQLKEEADVLLFDSPPILAVTDASILANQVDGVLLVVDAGATRRGVAQRGKEQLDKVGANVFGAALNKLSHRGRGGYYYYYYYSSEEGGERRKKRGRRRSGREAGVLGVVRRWVASLPLVGRRD